MAKKRSSKAAIFIILIIIAIIVGAVGVMIFRSQLENTTRTGDAPKPLFSFSGVEGWREGPSNETSMALFGPQRENGTSACFVSIQYKPGEIDIDKALNDQQSSYNSSSGKMTQIDTVTTTLQTNDGEKEYVLHHYKIEGAVSGESVMGGLGLGYLQLKDGYVQADSHCETADQLSTTLPALKAYKLDK